MDKELSKANFFKLDIPLKDGSITGVVAMEFMPGWCYHKSVNSYGKGYWTISYKNTAQSLCTAKKTKILDAVKKFQELFTQEDNKTLCNEIESNLKNGHKELEYIDSNLLDKLREVHRVTN